MRSTSKVVTMPKLADPEKPLTDEEFSTFERLFHRPLPLSFKRHYMADNGRLHMRKTLRPASGGFPCMALIRSDMGSSRSRSWLRR
jgi:hypothetical protein